MVLVELAPTVRAAQAILNQPDAGIFPQIQIPPGDPAPSTVPPVLALLHLLALLHHGSRTHVRDVRKQPGATVTARRVQVRDRLGRFLLRLGGESETANTC